MVSFPVKGGGKGGVGGVSFGVGNGGRFTKYEVKYPSVIGSPVVQVCHGSLLASTTSTICLAGVVLPVLAPLRLFGLIGEFHF